MAAGWHIPGHKPERQFKPDRDPAFHLAPGRLGRRTDVINIAHQMRVRVPQDLAITGYDTSSPGAMLLIGLASVDQNAHRMGFLPR